MKVISLFQKFDYYKNIDEMPIYNWFKVQETNDLTWLLKEKEDCTTKQMLVLEMYIQKMRDEYIDTFGISDTYRKILVLQGELACLEIDFIIKQDKKIRVFINLKRNELEKLIAKSQKKDSVNIQVHASKYMGGALINMKTTSVKEFYGILAEMQKEAKKQNKK